MRQAFAKVIHELMENDTDIFFLTGDLGMFVLDDLKKDFPERFINTGASEQSMLDIAVGLSYAKKKVITYTITPFYYRSWETIRTYLDHEQLPILLAGSGRDADYATHDGFSHDASDFMDKMRTNANITQYYPDLAKLKSFIMKWYDTPHPAFISLVK